MHTVEWSENGVATWVDVATKRALFHQLRKLHERGIDYAMVTLDVMTIGTTWATPSVDFRGTPQDIIDTLHNPFRGL